MPDGANPIDILVDATPVFGPDPDLTSATLFAFMTDLAQAVHSNAVIAHRYGFRDEAAAARYLRTHPEIIKRIKELRAIWQSDDALETRLRRLAGHAVLEAMPDTAKIMFDTSATANTRLDALKAHSRIAGVDGLPPVSKDGSGVAATGGRFSVNIVFTGAGKTETITTIEPTPEVTTVVESEAA